MLAFRRIAASQVGKNSRWFSFHEHTVNSNAPLLERARNVWPDPDYQLIGTKLDIPARTVPESALRWGMTASFTNANVIVYPHLKINPADVKVIMKVRVLR